MLIFLLAMPVGCGRFDTDRARSDFLRERPDYVIESVAVGEGDGGAAYVHIRHRRPGELFVREEVWQYLGPDESNRYRLGHREARPVPK